VFEAPDELRLDRAPNPHIAFGAGIHFCLGSSLARAEARVALPALLARFPSMRLADVPHRWSPTVVDRSLLELPVLLG
jgi:pimeloyl-[acyl-carrier protein] synthase